MSAAARAVCRSVRSFVSRLEPDGRGAYTATMDRIEQPQHVVPPIVITQQRVIQRWRLLGLGLPMFLLVACSCMPFGAIVGQSSQPRGPLPPGMGMPIAFDNLPPTARCRIAAEFALTTHGVLYSQGGNLPADPIDPSTGMYYSRTGPSSYDCSGMTQTAYARAGVKIGPTTYSQVNDGTEIPCSPADLRGTATSCWTTGDLAVFLNNSGPYHIAMYIRDGIFAECLNHRDGCRVWERPPSTFPARMVVRRIVGDCVRSIVPIAGDGSWRGQGIRNAMTAMGLGDAGITGQFNAPRGDHRHGGTDFAIGEGTPVYALFGGTVDVSEYIDWPNGNYVIIRSASGQRAYYGHFQSRTVNTGDTIDAGTLIGFVGTTGWVTGPHVHFQITEDSGGEWIDPELYFGPDTASASLPFTVPWTTWTSVLAWEHAPSTQSTRNSLSRWRSAAFPIQAQPAMSGRTA